MLSEGSCPMPRAIFTSGSRAYNTDVPVTIHTVDQYWTGLEMDDVERWNFSSCLLISFRVFCTSDEKTDTNYIEVVDSQFVEDSLNNSYHRGDKQRFKTSRVAARAEDPETSENDMRNTSGSSVFQRGCLHWRLDSRKSRHNSSTHRLKRFTELL